MIEFTNYGGWENNLKLTNGLVEAVITLDVGPRIISFSVPGEMNFFKEFSKEMGGSEENEWKIRGGHRFWHAPESIPRTYVLDNTSVTWEKKDDLTLCLTPPPEMENGVQREMELQMLPDSCSITIIHRLKNIGCWSVEMSCWGLSVMAEGGCAVIPLPRSVPHMEQPNPAYHMSVWSYSDMGDPRLSFNKEYLLIDHFKAGTSLKLGISVSDGWVAYAVNGMLFIKYFDWVCDKKYPDNGCNFETYSEKSFLELESLGPLRLLNPGESVEHIEQWQIIPEFDMANADAIELIYSIVKKFKESHKYSVGDKYDV